MTTIDDNRWRLPYNGTNNTGSDKEKDEGQALGQAARECSGSGTATESQKEKKRRMMDDEG